LAHVFESLIPAGEVDSRRGLDLATFAREYKNRNLPVKLEQALTDWPAVGLWNPDYLAERFGTREIEAGDRRVKMVDFVRAIGREAKPSGSNLYIRQTKLREVFPELLPHIEPLPPFLRRNWLDATHLPRQFRPFSTRDFELLFGGASSYFPTIHYDFNHQHAFIMQIYGRKDVYAFPPASSDYLYPEPAWPNKSTVSIFGNVDNYPKLKRAELYRATLRGGDCLFVPTGWWHAVINPEVSIAVTCNYVDRSNWREFAADWLDGQDYSMLKGILARIIFRLAGHMRARRERDAG
jgi:histone arginine demethylase JMJD6